MLTQTAYNDMLDELLRVKRQNKELLQVLRDIEACAGNWGFNAAAIANEAIAKAKKS